VSLIQKPTPALAVSIAQDDSRRVGIRKSADGVAVGVAESISDACVAESFGRSFPDVTELVAQANVVAIAVPVDVGASFDFLNVEEPAGHLGVNFAAFVDHNQSIYLICARAYEVGALVRE
jgi:hypothetical protein